MKKFIYLLLLLLFLYSSCIKEIEIELKNTEKQIVVNCLFCPDSLFSLHLTYTSNYFETNTEIVDNASIELWSGNSKIDNFIYIGNGFYESTIVAATETPYTVKIYIQGFKIIYATDTIPSNANYDILSNFDYCKKIDEYLFSTLNFNITENNNLGFYELFFPTIISKLNDNTLLYTLSLFSTQSNIINDELNYKFGNFYPSVIFSSKYFQNQLQNFSIDYETEKVIVHQDSFFETIDTNLMVVLQLNKISNSYYNYKKSLNQAKIINSLPDLYNTNRDFYIYSNLTNAIGIFAGFNPIYDTLIYDGENTF